MKTINYSGKKFMSLVFERMMTELSRRNLLSSVYFIAMGELVFSVELSHKRFTACAKLENNLETDLQKEFDRIDKFLTKFEV